MTLFRVNIKATDPGLDAGLPVLFPTAGEILRDAWWEVVTAWNASPALADVGQFVNGYPHGIYGAAAAGPVDVTYADSQPGGDGDMLVGATENDLQVRAALGAATPTDALRAAPARFTSDAPLLVVVSKDGTPSSAPGVQAVVDAAAPPTFAGGDAAAVTADTPPTIPAATPASVTADAAPTIPAGPQTASVTAAAPATVPTVVVEGVNDTFKFGAPGSEVVYTVAPGTYTTLAELEGAMDTALFGTGVYLTDDGTTLTLATVNPGPDFNGWDLLTGATDFLAASGFSSGQALEGGSTDGGLVVAAAFNDTFQFGAPGSEVVYTVAPGTYTTLAEVAAAMLGAENPGHTGTLFDIASIDVSGSKLEAVTVLGGGTWNGWHFLTGATDFLAASGFANAQALEGGTDGGLVVVTGDNDTFKFGAPSSEVTYTVAPGSYTTLAEVAAAMSAAVDGSSSPLSAVVVVGGPGATALYAQAVEVGASYNGWDFVTGATDFLAASGFTSGQALEGGEDPGGGGPTGATAGEVNLYLEIEAPYPPAPWYAPTKPNVPAFPWAGQV